LPVFGSLSDGIARLLFFERAANRSPDFLSGEAYSRIIRSPRECPMHALVTLPSISVFGLCLVLRAMPIGFVIEDLTAAGLTRFYLTSRIFILLNRAHL
jgi:hypothetical protein